MSAGRPRGSLSWRSAPIVAVLLACEGAAPAPAVVGPMLVQEAASSAAVVDDLAAPTECADHSSFDVSSAPPLPVTPYTGTFEQVWEIVRLKHFDPTLGCLDWPALRLEYGARLASVEETSAAYAAMNELLGRLGQSHFHVLPPAADSGVDDLPHGAARAPLALRWIEEQMIVVDAAVGGIASGVPQGAALVSVDGRAVSELVARTRARTKRTSELAFELRRAVDGWLSGEPGTQRRIRYLDPRRGDREREVAVACALPPGETVSVGNLRDLATTVEWRMIRGTTVGYLAFNYWMLPMVQRVEAGMNALRDAGMTALVLDLRGNPGGVGAMSVPVARLLLRETGSLGVLHFRDFKQEFLVAGSPTAFAGPVALLVDEGTASTSEIFATGLRDLGRVQIVGGRASAGAALPSLVERLEGGATLQYVVGDYHSSKGSVAEGDGVVPDVLVVETRADFVAGRDPALEAAIRAVSVVSSPGG